MAVPEVLRNNCISENDAASLLLCLVEENETLHELQINSHVRLANFSVAKMVMSFAVCFHHEMKIQSADLMIILYQTYSSSFNEMKWKR